MNSTASLANAVPSAQLEEAATDTKKPKLEEVVVEGYQTSPDALYRNATFIDRESIRLSAANSLADLLAAQANLHIVSFNGSGRETRIDIRGSGDASASNILLIVDDQILPSADLGGIDLTTLPLDRIDSVEIIRGANSVRYGGGASQGIIKITTRKARRNALTVRTETGSFGFDKNSVIAELSGVAGDLVLDYIDTDNDGYRDHSRESSWTNSASYRWRPSELSRVDINYTNYSDRYELPGALALADIENGAVSPKSASTGSLFSGSISQERIGIQLQHKINHRNQLVFALSNNNQRDETIEQPPGASFQFEGLIATDSNSATLTQRYAMNENFSVESGLFFQTIDHDRINPYFPGDPSGTRLNTDYRTKAAYLYSTWTNNSTLSFSMGYRRDETRLIDTVFGAESGLISSPSTHEDWDNEALEIGISLTGDSGRAYLSAANTFRNPNADEIQLTAAQPLIPQQAGRFEIGYEYLSSIFSLSVSLFRYELDNEIVFRPIGFVGGALIEGNLNETQSTRKQGAEFSINTKPLDWLTVNAATGYLNAEYRDGNKIPLVPDLTASATAILQLKPGITWSIGGRYLSKRYDGNDLSNNDTQLSSATLFESKLSADFEIAELGLMSLFISGTNLFNEYYVTAAYSQTGYPHPTRAIKAGLSLSIR